MSDGKHVDGRWYLEMSYNDAKILLDTITAELTESNRTKSYNAWMSTQALQVRLQNFISEFERQKL